MVFLSYSASLLCSIAAEYILEGFDNNLFASKLVYVLPNKEELIKEIEKIINE